MQENSGMITRKQLQITAHLYRKEATALLGTAVSTHMIGRLSTIVVAETTECSDGQLFGFVEFESSCIFEIASSVRLVLSRRHTKIAGCRSTYIATEKIEGYQTRVILIYCSIHRRKIIHYQDRNHSRIGDRKYLSTRCIVQVQSRLILHL